MRAILLLELPISFICTTILSSSDEKGRQKYRLHQSGTPSRRDIFMLLNIGPISEKFRSGWSMTPRRRAGTTDYV
jgi:hypothetical protein